MIIFINGEQRTVDDAATLVDVLGQDAEDGRPRRGIAVALNGSVVPTSGLADARLSDGSRVEIVTAVQGG